MLSNNVGLTIAILSYGENLNFTIVADRKMLPKPQGFIEYMQESVDEMKAALNNTSVKAVNAKPVKI
jgi:hypothetical protein